MELTIEQALKQGVAAHKEGKLQEAERLYRAILKSEPAHPDANHNLGVIAVAYGQYESALPFFKNAISTNFQHEQYWQSFLETLIKMGNIHEARKALRHADPEFLKKDKLKSLVGQLNHPSKLDFFYRYLKEIGVFTSIEGELLNGDSEPVPLLTSSFLDWFKTQQWNSSSLLELGAGGSTLYFSSFFKSVTSYETNQSWFDKLLVKKPNNVDLIKADTIVTALQQNKKNIHCFDVILIDASENRAKIARWLVNEGYRGVIFFDNSEWYRNSIKMFLKAGFVEIPFFGLKPTEDWVSCTSILAEPSALKNILDSNWISPPKLAREMITSWDDESIS